MKSFKQFFEILSDGATLNITILKKENDLVVSLYPGISGGEVKSQEYMVPLVLKGTPQELDEQFFEEITEPIQHAVTALSNVKAFEESVSKVKPKSKIISSTDSNKQIYDKLLQEAESLVKKKDYTNALITFQKASKMSVANSSELEKRIKYIEQLKNIVVGNLFASSEPQNDEVKVDELSYEIEEMEE